MNCNTPKFPQTKKKRIVNTGIQELSARDCEALYLVYQLEPLTAQDVQANLTLEARCNSVRRLIDSLVEERFAKFERIGRNYRYRPLLDRAPSKGPSCSARLSSRFLTNHVH